MSHMSNEKGKHVQDGVGIEKKIEIYTLNC